MQPTRPITAALAPAAALVLSASALAQGTAPSDRPASAPPAGQVDEAELMRQWLAASEPGPMHEVLMRGVGSWQARMKSWLQPGAPPVESTGTAKVTGEMYGRFTRLDYTGSFGPLPFSGSGTYGYNNATGKFESVWIDSMSTGMLLMTGTYDAPKREFTWTGTMVDPTDHRTKSLRSVERYLDDDTATMEMYGPGPDGKEVKTMEIRFTRVGGAKPVLEQRNPRPLPAERVPPAKK
jgi:hypothetical protein